MGTWFGDDARRTLTGDTDRRAWLDTLPSLCTAICAQSGDGRTMAALLATRSWPPLRDQVDRRSRGEPSRRAASLGELGPPVAAVLAAAAACEATELRDEVVKFLNQDNDDLLPCRDGRLRAGAPLDPSARPESGLDAIARHCATRLGGATRPPAPSSR